MLQLVHRLTSERLNYFFAEITHFQPFQEFVTAFILEPILSSSSCSLQGKEVKPKSTETRGQANTFTLDCPCVVQEAL